MEDTGSKFLILANSEDHKDESFGLQNELQYHKFDSNRSRPRTRQDKKYTVSPPTIQSIKLVDEKTKEKLKKGDGKLSSPSVEITPANSHYLGFTVESHLQNSSPIGKASIKDLPFKK